MNELTLSLVVNLLLVLATVGGGVIAYLIYRNQKKDFKRDAASIVLVEIRRAEDLIDKIKEGLPLNLNTVLLPVNNWDKYNYLFTNDFDFDELNLLNNFYNQCILVDKAIWQLTNLGQLDQKSQAMHNKLSEFAANSKNVDEFLAKKQLYLELIEKDNYLFSPIAPQMAIKDAIDNVKFVTTSSAGTKLKKIAR